MTQLHKRFTYLQVKELLERYVKREIKRDYIQQVLNIKKRRFFILVKLFLKDPDSFSLKYVRTNSTRSIDPVIEQIISKELSIDKKLIEHKKVPLYRYNYSYIQSRIQEQLNLSVSVPTIINRAKKYQCYIPRKSFKNPHDREVLTNHIGELIQHDSSHHLFSPYAQSKWYLITSLDDYSRYMLYAKLFSRESTWAHISALENVFLYYGFPWAYYIDSHSIFRFVRGRDEMHYKHHLFTDDVDPQWKQVLDDCQVKATYALSPQAKGKIERPYQWIQDRLVRTCAREQVSDISHAQSILDREIHRYNNLQVHSTTGEIPHLRFQYALKNNISLFRSFAVKPPFISHKDIFCLRLQRTADGYRKISINNVELKVNKLNPYQRVILRIYPLNSTFSEVRFWVDNTLVDVQKLKNDIFKGVHF